MKRLNQSLGVEKERCRALTKVRDWLKDKANLGPDFTFDDPEMKSALECNDCRLQSENAELSRQIESLEGMQCVHAFFDCAVHSCPDGFFSFYSSCEGERIKLLSQLRERAIDIGEKGGRFLGMSPEQVSQVLEFASNLRRGVAGLPLNDRSKELLLEISRLKSERAIDKVTIVSLEREIAAREPTGGDSRILKQILENMTTENQRIRDELKAVTSVAKPIEDSVIARVNLLSKVEALQQADDTKQMTCRDDALLDSKVGAAVDAHESNEKSLDIESLERTIKNISHERDALCSQVRKLVAETENGPSRLDAISELVTLTVKYKALEEELREEKGKGFKAQQNLDESRKRILLLEQWKLIATNTMERHVATYDSSYTTQISPDCVGIIRDLLQQRGESVNLMNKIGDNGNGQNEVDRMNRLLKQTQGKLSGYVGDVKALRTLILSLQESHIDSSRAASYIRCLNDIIQEKSRIILEGTKKVADLKQRNTNRVQDREYRGQRSDLSTSTNSIDEAIVRTADSAGHEPHSLNSRNRQKYSEDASELLSEKENIICEQNHKIMELKQKLLQADVTYQRLSNEAQSMKADSKSY